MWGMIMEDLLAKFYGKPESKGSSDAPMPSESDDRLAKVEQRVGQVETQLLEISKAQQTILSRLDTMIDQHPSQPAPQHEWQSVPPISQPKPAEFIVKKGTPETRDPINNTLHAMDDVSEDGPSQQEQETRRDRWSKKPKQTCTSCGRRIPLQNLRLTNMGLSLANLICGGPETLVCTRCYEEHKQKVVQKKMTIGAVTFGIIVFLIMACN